MDWISDIRSLIMTGYLKFIITLKRKFYWPSGGTHHHWQPHTNRDLYITTRRMYCRVIMGGQKQITSFSLYLGASTVGFISILILMTVVAPCWGLIFSPTVFRMVIPQQSRFERPTSKYVEFLTTKYWCFSTEPDPKWSLLVNRAKKNKIWPRPTGRCF